MKLKLFYWMIAIALVVGVTSCGNDDDPVMGDKSDLISNYNGNQSVYLTDIKRDTVKTTSTVRFEQYTKDTRMLSVSVSDLGTGILASNFTITKDAYSFNMDVVNLSGLTGNQIPSYVKEWFTGAGKDFDSLDKIDLKLNPTTGKFDRKTNKMEFTYSGDLTIYPKIGEVAQDRKIYKITFKYFNLIK